MFPFDMFCTVFFCLGGGCLGPQPLLRKREETIRTYIYICIYPSQMFPFDMFSFYFSV